jgi:predicted RNase H-like nuclease (RuvC/YqgF family)
MSMTTAYEAFIMAMERVERRLKQVTSALDEAAIPYAVVGGNAVAAWIATVDPAGRLDRAKWEIVASRCYELSAGVLSREHR